MAPTFKLQCHFILICLLALRGESRYPELREAVDYDPFPHLSGGASPKRELEGEPLYSRALRCVDMLSLQGQFTFTADRPQLHCATFFIAEPEEFITIRYDLVSIDCQRGDILQVPFSVESFQAPKGCLQRLGDPILEQKGTGHWEKS